MSETTSVFQGDADLVYELNSGLVGFLIAMAIINSKAFRLSVLVMCLGFSPDNPRLLASEVAESAVFFQYFKKTGDLTEKRLGEFLNAYPGQKPWVLNYVSSLPDYILTDRRKQQLCHFISNQTRNTVAKVVEQGNLLPIVESSYLFKTYDESDRRLGETGGKFGWNYRFYRGPIFEYHFDESQRVNAQPHKGLVSYEIDWR